MKGLEISREYYEKFGKPMLCENFSDILPYIAVGLCGKGSECFGYDDDISRDHDFEPGFIIFLPNEDIVDRRRAFLLERAYFALPKEFGGISRQQLAPVGGERHGVVRTYEFFQKNAGTPNGVLSILEWLTIPEYVLFEATNGMIFEDNYGEVTNIRKKLSYMPEDIRRKRLAGRLIIMAQSGQYNYKRCLAHGETAAAQLSIFEFVRHAMEAVFLLNRRPMPYYKWAFRAFASLEILGNMSNIFEYLITSDNSSENVKIKADAIENICRLTAETVEKQGIAKADTELERLAYSVNDSIKDADIRLLSIFYTV